jgi:hypothetical protein
VITALERPSTERDNRAVLATSGLRWRFLGAFNHHMVKVVFAEQAHKITLKHLPHTIRIRADRGKQAHADGRWRRLYNLEQLDRRDAIDQGAKDQGREPD